MGHVSDVHQLIPDEGSYRVSKLADLEDYLENEPTGKKSETNTQATLVKTLISTFSFSELRISILISFSLASLTKARKPNVPYTSQHGMSSIDINLLSE